MRFCLPWLVVLAASAQTDYFYLVSSPTHREVFAVGVNSQNFRELPGSPYPFEFYPEDIYLSFAHSLTVSEPGPFLYASRQDPSQIYGYRRLLDGHLEPLPGFPIFVQPTPPTTGDTGLVWMAHHPTLPILYGSNAVKDNLSMYQIQVDGSLLELPESPYFVSPKAISPQALVLTPDGTTAFFNTFRRTGIFAMDVDQQTGGLRNLRQAMPFGRGRGVVVSSGGKYLYATESRQNKIFGFSILNGELQPLPNFPIEIPLDPIWLFVRDNFMAVGGYKTMKVSIMVIGNDGSLAFAPGSPTEIFSWQTTYSAFSADGNRILFGGNSYNHVYDLDPTGRLTPIAQGPVEFDAINFGVSASTETIGDPFHLNFAVPPEPGDASITIRGDPDTPFYLKVDGVCEGPYSTGSDGQIVIPREVTIDQSILIMAYCDEVIPVTSFQSVPVLGLWGLVSLVCLMVIGGLWIQKYREA